MDDGVLVLLFLCFCGMAVADPGSGSCYRIDPGTMSAIIVADVVLTLVVVMVTYHCASRRRRRKDNADKVYMNVRANCKA